MSQAQQAADDIKQLARRFQPLMEAAKVLEQIGNLENASTEAERRKEAAEKDAGEAIAKRDTARAELKDAEDEVVEARKRATATQDEAKAKASQIVSEANQKATEIIKVANGKKTAIEAEIATKRDELAEVIEAKTKAETELADIQTHIRETKERLAAFIQK